MLVFRHMRLSSETFVRACDPDHDLEVIVSNIIATGYYRDGQDDPDTLGRFLARNPDGIIVAEDPVNGIIAGSLCAPDSPIPVISRIAINPVFKINPHDDWECQGLLLNGAFDLFRDRYPRLPHVEILYDWQPSRPEPPAPLDWEYKRLGFSFGCDLYSVEHRLWDDQGNPVYLPSFRDNKPSA